MAENVGGIQYTVDADTAAMIKAEAVVNKSIANQVKDFEKADAQVRKYIKTQELMGRTINSMGQVIDKNGDIVEIATRRYRAFTTQANATYKAIGQADAVASKGTTRMTQHAQAVKQAGDQSKKSSFQMSNMSYQLQDIAVQTQMGTNAFIVMSQQLPQMMTGMGGVAAAIGAVIAVGGLLATTLIDTTSDTTKFNQAIERTKAVMTLGAGGVVEYTQKMQDLGRISEAVAQYQIKNAMNDAQAAIKLAVKEMSNSLSEVDDTVLGTQFGFAVENQAILGTNAMRDYTVKIGNFLGVVGDASDRSGDKAQEAGAKFIRLFASINQAKTPKEITEIQEELIKMASANGIADKKFREMFTSLMSAKDGTEDYFTKLRQLTAVLEEGAKGATDFSNSTNKAKETTSGMVNELISQIVALKDGERAALSYQLQLDGLDESEKAHILSLYDKKKATEADIEATEKAVEADEKRKKSIDDINASLDAYFDKESQDDRKKSERETTTNLNFAQNIIDSGKSPEERMAEQYERLDQLRKTDLENAQVYEEAMSELQIQAQEAREEELSESYKRIGQSAADSMGDYLSGAKTAEEATRQLASTIISEAIQSLVQLGISSLTQTAATTAATTGGIAATTTAAVTSTGVMAGAQSTALATVGGVVGTLAGGLATAWAPAAAFASLATLGTNAAPAIAGIYSTMAATLGAQLVGGLASNAITAATGFSGPDMGGAREFGGPVTSGKSYLVGERGPEIFTPNIAGGITSNKDLTGGASQPQININNYSGQPVTQNYDEINKIVNIAIGKQINGVRKGTGDLAKAIKSSTTSKNRATTR